MYLPFKIILDKGHSDVSKANQYLTLKVPKSSVKVAYYFNIMLTLLVTSWALFYNAWYNKIVCEKITNKVSQDLLADRGEFIC